MATSKFMREPRMFTTEPSVDEVGDGMKRGGRAKKHAMGGHIRNEKAELKRVEKEIRGGRKEERNEHAEIKRVQKELKHHESMKAKSAHHGLKAGGRAPKAGPDVMGGLAGGIEATRRNPKHMTEGIEGPGYKHGGKVHHISGHPVGSHEHHKAMAKHHAAKHKEGGSAHHKKMHEHHKHEAKMCMGGKMYKKDGGAVIDRFETKTTLKPKIDVKDKVHQAKQTKSFSTKTGGVEGLGYKRGGHLKKFAKGGTVSGSVANRYENTLVHDGAKMPTKKAGTGSIKEGVAGYKHGGHVAHHKHHSVHETHGGHVSHHKHSTKHHAHGGHVSHKEHMAHGGHAHKVHTTKVSTAKKAGGKCNY